MHLNFIKKQYNSKLKTDNFKTRKKLKPLVTSKFLDIKNSFINDHYIIIGFIIKDIVIKQFINGLILYYPEDNKIKRIFF